MSNKIIQHKRSSVAGNVPAAGVLAPGELGINFADKSIYTEDGGGNVIELERDIYKQAAAPASPVHGDVWFDTDNGFMQVYDITNKWVPLTFNGADVLPANTTFLIGAPGGTGTSGTPYTLTATTTIDMDQLIESIVITGLEPGQYVQIVDENASANGGRFYVTNYIADSTGTLRTNIRFYDQPTSPGGTVYGASYRIGNNTVYVDVNNTLVAPSLQAINWPTTLASVSTSWTDPNTTLTAASCALVSTDDITFSTSVSINTGDTLYVKWDGAPGSGTCADSAHGTVLNGTITDGNGSVSTGSFTVDKSFPFTWTDTNGHAVSSVTSSNTVNVTPVNSYCYIYSGSGTTGLQYSKNGGAWTNVPAAASASHYAVDGDTVQIRHTNSATNGTTTSSDVFIGVGNDSYDTATIALTPTVATPSITAPANNATGVSTSPTISSSGYSGLSGAGPHGQSDWEIYDAAVGGTLVASSMADGTNLTSWSPTGLSASTQYWVRVKHRSDGTGAPESGTPTESSWSARSAFTTAALVVTVNTPTVTAPSNGATNVNYSAPITFSSSAFSGTNTTTHGASQWQISTSNTFGTTVWASTTGLTTNTVPAGSLSSSTTYYFRVRHQDSPSSVWSSWSTPISITTQAGPSIDKPLITSPTVNQALTGVSHTFTSSAYSPQNGAGAHASTEWEIATSSTFGGTVIASTTDADANKVSELISGLNWNDTLFARVRYTDGSIFSPWSDTRTFSTPAPGVNTPSIATPANGATGLDETAVSVTSSAYSTVNAGTGPHGSTDWEIYDAAVGGTLVASSIGDTTNLTSWTPSGLAAGTSYWVRVKHNSDGTGGGEGGTDTQSLWSTRSEFATAAAVSYVIDLSSIADRYATSTMTCAGSAGHSLFNLSFTGNLTRETTNFKCSISTANLGTWFTGGSYTDYEYSATRTGSTATGTSVTYGGAWTDFNAGPNLFGIDTTIGAGGTVETVTISLTVREKANTANSQTVSFTMTLDAT